jgi:hypothetical protein
MLKNIKYIKHKIFKNTEPRYFLLNKMPKNAICAEIGSWKGDFSQRILDTTQPQKLFLIDPYKHVNEYKKAWYGGDNGSQEQMDEIHDSVAARFSDNIKSGQMEILRDDSENALQKFDKDYFDWIYVDGNHTYEFVKADLNYSWDKLKVDGYLTGDDYNLEGWWEDGVTKAVDEFIEIKKGIIKVVAIKGTQFILKKIGN